MVPRSDVFRTRQRHPLENRQFVRVLRVYGQVDCPSEQDLRPVACLLPEADPKNLELIDRVLTTERVALGASGLLSLNFEGDNLSFLPIGLASLLGALPDVFALSENRCRAARQPDGEVGMVIEVVGFVPIYATAHQLCYLPIHVVLGNCAFDSDPQAHPARNRVE